jgi:Uncharacterised nucleotidyltransferase
VALARPRRAGTLKDKVNNGYGISGAAFCPEERLILNCLRYDAAAAATGADVREARGPADDLGVAIDLIDWNRVILTAGSHGVLPLVYRRLKSVNGLAPAAIAPLRAEFYGNALNNMHVTRELARVSALLGAQNIPAIAFKGPVLALQAWGDVALRQFNDLDLLVRPAETARAAEVLIAAGYWPVTYDRRYPEISVARRCEDEFVRPGTPWTIDLHWEFNPAYFAYGPAASDVWDRATSIHVEDADVMTLGPDDLVLFLAVHATKHGWINLGGICDFDAALRARSHADISALVDAARRYRCLRMLLLGTVLAADLLGASIPPLLDDAIERDATVGSLAAGVERRLFANVGKRAPLTSEWVVPTQAIAGSRERIRYVAGRVLKPDTEDFGFIGLPRMLHPLYYAVRPFRLVWQQGRRLFVDVPHPLKRLRGAPR